MKPTESAAAARPAVARTWVWTLAIIFPVLAGIYWLRHPSIEATKLRVTPLTSYPGDEQQPSLSPDGNQVAFAWNAGRSSKKNEANSNDYDIYTKPVGSEDLFALTSTRLTISAQAGRRTGRRSLFYVFFPISGHR